MKKIMRCLPVGALPYDTDAAVTRLMVKLYERNPYLPFLPKISPNDNIINRTLLNIPGIKIKHNKVFFDPEDKDLKQQLVAMDIAFNNPTSENLEDYKFDSCYLEKYDQILNRIKPETTVINLLGPFTLSQMIITDNNVQLLADKYYRKLIIQIISLRALWIINRIKSVSPHTTPIIVLEESMLHKAGSVKRVNEDITAEIIVNVFSKVISKIKDAGAKVCVQSFGKCDWQIPIVAGVDIISFDAYNNPNNLNIIAEKVNEFMAKGGRINWAIVPTPNETIVKSLSADIIYNRLIKTMENFISDGGSEKLTYNRALASIAGDTDHLPLLFAENAIIYATKIASKLPFKN